MRLDKETVQALRSLIFSKSYVVGYSNSLKPRIRRGRIVKDEKCIRIYVERKLDARTLGAANLIPCEIDGIPTDVVEVGRIMAPPPISVRALEDRTKVWRPLIFGISIGNRMITAGTNGALWEKDGEVYLGSNAHVYCYSKDTEVLTEDGWKPFSEVTAEDKIATLNEATGVMEYQKPTAVVSYYYKGKMIRVKMKGRIDLLVTPDHHFFLLKGRKKVPVHMSGWRLLAHLNEHPYPDLYLKEDARWACSRLEYVVLPRSEVRERNQFAEWVQLYQKNVESIPIVPFLKFLGWYLSEGSCSKCGRNKMEHMIAIRNTNPKYLDEIADIVREMGFKPYKDGGSVKFYSKQLYEYLKPLGYSDEKYVPKEFKQLPPEQLRYLFETLIKGDGCVTKWGIIYCSASKKLADDVQEIAIKLGYRATIRVKHGSTFNPNGTYYVVHICKPRYHRVTKDIVELVDYDGMVYDVTVPNHIILVRRNGKAVWSGNCVDATLSSQPCLDIVQPGTYDGGTEKVAELVYYKQVNATSCPTAKFLVWLYNSLNSARGGTHRLYAVDTAGNKIDFAVARAIVDFKEEWYELDTLGRQLVGHLFAGSDMVSVFCKASNIVEISGYKPHGFQVAEVAEGMRVVKSGRTTGVTRGTIIDESATVNVGYGANKTAIFTDVIMSDLHCEGGDSGSAVFTD